MTRTKFKKIPFDIELAKKITNKEVKGRIVTRDGCQARIVCFERNEKGWPIIALVKILENYESVIICKSNGAYSNFEEKDLDLLIEIPTYYRDYSNFEPQKWQPCLVRDNEKHLWGVQVYAFTNCQGKMLFYNDEGYLRPYSKVLPLSKVTKRLIGTTKSYEELIKDFDGKGKD